MFLSSHTPHQTVHPHPSPSPGESFTSGESEVRNIAHHCAVVSLMCPNHAHTSHSQCQRQVLSSSRLRETSSPRLLLLIFQKKVSKKSTHVLLVPKCCDVVNKINPAALRFTVSFIRSQSPSVPFAFLMSPNEMTRAF